MNGQEALRRLAQQLQRANSGGGPRIPGGGKGLFAGGGLVVALVGGGLLLNASLFNGMYLFSAISPLVSDCTILSVVDGGHRAIKYTRYVSSS